MSSEIGGDGVKATTRKAAAESDYELASEAHRAITVYRDKADAGGVDLAGYHLRRTDHQTWVVCTPQDYDTTDDLEIIDELNPLQFPAARAITRYLHGIQTTEDTDDTGRNRPGVV